MTTPTKRGPGRPKGSGKGESPVYRVRVNPALYARLDAAGPDRVREVLEAV